MCASQQDTGEEPQPPEPQPHALSPPSSRKPSRPYTLLTFRPPRRPQPDDAPLSGADPLPAGESRTAGEPPTASESLTASEPSTASEPPAASQPETASEPPTADSPPGNDPPQQAAQAQISGNPSTGMYATRLLDASMIVIGAALFLCALATLSSTWAWSWHAGSAGIFTLSRMHGVCTSAMGELAQGASSNVAKHCLWVDGTWTEAVALTGGGCILAAIGVARIVRAMRTPT